MNKSFGALVLGTSLAIGGCGKEKEVETNVDNVCDIKTRVQVVEIPCEGLTNPEVMAHCVETRQAAIDALISTCVTYLERKSINCSVRKDRMLDCKEKL